MKNRFGVRYKNPYKNLNKIQKKFNYVFYTQDWHPIDHISFSTNNIGKKVFSTIEVPYGEQVIWPPHCIFNTKGAEFHKELEVKYANAIITTIIIDGISIKIK